MMAAHAAFTMKGSPSATCTTSMAAWAAGADITSAMAAVATAPATACRSQEVDGGTRSAEDSARQRFQKIRQEHESLAFGASCRALRRSLREGLAGTPGGSANAQRRRPKPSAQPSRSYKTVMNRILSHDRKHSAVDHPGAGRASRRQTPPEPLVAEERKTARMRAFSRGARDRPRPSVRDRDRCVVTTRVHHRGGHACQGRATRGELPERVARHADCRALFRADTIARVFATRRTFCWTRTASTGAAAFATMAVRRAVLPERAATRAGSAILQV